MRRNKEYEPAFSVRSRRVALSDVTHMSLLAFGGPDAESWRQVAYLLIGGRLGSVAFGEVLGMVIACAVLLITVVGVVVFIFKA